MDFATYDFDMKQNSALIETPLQVAESKTIPAVIDSRYK